MRSMSRHALISTACGSTQIQRPKSLTPPWMGFAEYMLLFRSATSARHWTSDHCIFCYILELRGLCFRRRVQIVYGPFNLQPVPGLEDVFLPLYLILLNQAEFVARP
jgi:hypothetical protein